MELLLVSFHLMMTIHYVFSCYVYFFDIHPPKEYLALRTSMGGQFKYLTCWNLVFHTLFFTLAFVNDLIGSTTRNPSQRSFLQKIKDFFYGSIVFPLGALVPIVFWGLYVINRELIFPKLLDSFFPWWLNHSIHTAPLAGIVIEMAICPRCYPSRRNAVTALTCVMVAYGVFILYIAYVTGFWVYPVLQKLTMIGRTALIAAVCIVGLIFFMAGAYLDKQVWKHKPKNKLKKRN